MYPSWLFAVFPTPGDKVGRKGPNRVFKLRFGKIKGNGCAPVALFGGGRGGGCSGGRGGGEGGWN